MIVLLMTIATTRRMMVLIEGCTSLAMGNEASSLGRPIVTHTMDESNNDFRLVSVPGGTFAKGAKRPVYRQNERYPRLVSNRSSPSYRPKDGQIVDEPIGYVDQAERTYGRYEASYGAMNERGLSITESTCGAKTVGTSLPDGKALFWIGELSQIALERCATARCAVDLMGDLAVAYGFYGEQEVEGSGETLLLADTNESWVFSVLSSPDGASAVWCAQRVPDDHVTVVANMYTIRGVNLTDPSRFRFSENMLRVAEEQGWWDGETYPFDFTRAFSIGEYGHQYYSGRRMWRVLSLMAPRLNLSATLGVNASVPTYPFSVKPERDVTVAMLRELNRDHYEGTPYDMTKGMAAGPFGSPNRLDGGTRFFPQPRGAWERPIAMYRTSYSLIIAPSEKSDGVLWYAPHNPHASVYVPFFQRAAGHPNAVPPSYAEGSQDAFDFFSVVQERNAWWATAHVMNWMDRMYSFMVGDVVAAQKRLESSYDRMVRSTSDEDETSVEDLVFMSAANAVHAATAWWELAGNLTQKFNDGYINRPDVGEITGYPEWWLKRVGYTHFPTPPPSEQCT